MWYNLISTLEAKGIFYSRPAASDHIVLVPSLQLLTAELLLSSLGIRQCRGRWFLTVSSSYWVLIKSCCAQLCLRVTLTADRGFSDTSGGSTCHWYNRQEKIIKWRYLLMLKWALQSSLPIMWDDMGIDGSTQAIVIERWILKIGTSS